MKDPNKMSAAEFKRAALRLERKYPGHIPLSAFPSLRKAGRPRRGDTREPMEGHTVKMPPRHWRKLQKMAQERQTTVSAVLRNLVPV